MANKRKKYSAEEKVRLLRSYSRQHWLNIFRLDSPQTKIAVDFYIISFSSPCGYLAFYRRGYFMSSFSCTDTLRLEFGPCRVRKHISQLSYRKS